MISVRDTSFNMIDLGQEQMLRDLCNVSGEGTQLEMTMYILDSLMGWCELCFNNKQEEKDYELLSQAYKLLEQVHESYKNNY